MKVLMEMLKMIFTRTLVLVLVVAAVLAGALDWHGIFLSAKLRVLNRLKPDSFMYLIHIARGEEKADPDRMEDYFHYLQKANEYLPKMSDAYGVAGFCYYHLGDKEKAAVALEKSIRLNPEFFWPYYNLSIIYFEQKKFSRVQELAKRALEIQPHVSMMSFYTSKIYGDILRDDGRQPPEIIKSLQEGYDAVNFLLHGSQAAMVTGYNRHDFSMIEDYKLRLF